MSALMYVNLAIAAVALLLAAWVGAIYARNHRTIRSPFTLALSLFALFFVVHNAVLVYHYLSMMAFFGVVGERFLLVEGLLQLAALGALLYAATR